MAAVQPPPRPYRLPFALPLPRRCCQTWTASAWWAWPQGSTTRWCWCTPARPRRSGPTASRSAPSTEAECNLKRATAGPHVTSDANALSALPPRQTARASPGCSVAACRRPAPTSEPTAQPGPCEMLQGRQQTEKRRAGSSRRVLRRVAQLSWGRAAARPAPAAASGGSAGAGECGAAAGAARRVSFAAARLRRAGSVGREEQGTIGVWGARWNTPGRGELRPDRAPP